MPDSSSTALLRPGARPIEAHCTTTFSGTPNQGLALRSYADGVPESVQREPVTDEIDVALPEVLLIDADPISRHVLGSRLRGGRQVQLVGVWDSRLPVGEFPVRQADLAILVSGPLENHVLLAQDIARWGIKSLLIGVDWTKHRLDAALASGVCGCLTKDWALDHLPQAASAAASGHVVLSPDLIALCVSMKPMAGGRKLEERLRCLTPREREVLAMLAEGMSTGEVSGSLMVSSATIKSHVSHALTKLGVRNRLEAVLLMQAALGCGIQRTDQ